MRILLLLFILLVITYLFLQGDLQQKEMVKPIFLVEDEIAKNHHTQIEISIGSTHRPNEYQLEVLKSDYANIWAHLNHLYQTNEVEIGKEYYTEDWYKQICANYEKPIKNPVQRIDLNHKLHIKNWSTDALVCTAIDSNVVFNNIYPNQKTKRTSANIAVVLLFQGDHWRIDAMKILTETSKN